LGRRWEWSAFDAGFQFCEEEGHFWKDNQALFSWTVEVQFPCNLRRYDDGDAGVGEEIITFP